jgi:hypothetical protein
LVTDAVSASPKPLATTEEESMSGYKPGTKRIYEVLVVVKETRTYVVEAQDQEDAESLAIEKAENGEEARKVEPFDGTPYVQASADVTKDYRDWDAENDLDREEGK